MNTLDKEETVIEKNCECEYKIVRNSLYYRKTPEFVKFYDINNRKIASMPYKIELTDEQYESILDQVHIKNCAVVESHLTYFACYDQYGTFIGFFYPVDREKMRKWLIEEWNKVSSDKCISSGLSSAKDIEYFRNGVRINYLRGILYRKDCTNTYEINYYSTHSERIEKDIMLIIKKRIADPDFHYNLRPRVIRLYQQDNHVIVNYYGVTYKPILTEIFYDLDLKKKVKHNRGILFSHEKIDKNWCYDHINKISIMIDNGNGNYRCDIV